MHVIKPPQPFIKSHHYANITMFLGGSIEMGVAEDWQTKITEQLAIYENVTVLNPRRDAWDSSWEQRMSNPQFAEQVVWELDSLDKADIIIMYFSPDTKSPISLLELGLFKDHRIYVCCPDGFWRKGNVEIVCDRYNIPLYDDLDSMLQQIIKQFKSNLVLL
jgi:hypothetical protein